jgi:hypothetical protein
MRKFLRWTGQRVVDGLTGAAMIAAFITMTIALRWLFGLTGSAEPVIRLVAACVSGVVALVMIGALVRGGPRRGIPAPPSPPEERLQLPFSPTPKWWHTASDEEIRARGFRNPAAVRCMGPLKAAAAQDRADEQAAAERVCGVYCTEVPGPLTEATGLMRTGRCALPPGHDGLHDPFPQERGARAMPLMIDMPEGGVPDAGLAREATDDEVRAALMGAPPLDGVSYPELTADEAAALFEDCRCPFVNNPPCGPCENGTVHPEGK